MQQPVETRTRPIRLDPRVLTWSNATLCEVYVTNENLPSGWIEFFTQPRVQTVLETISDELEAKSALTLYPPITDVFRAFYLTPFHQVRAVLIGMDPYHNGNATGLCFEVPAGRPVNPSLQMIFRELGVSTTDLTQWARGGILMLNMALTVEAGTPGAHLQLWSEFSELLVRYLSQHKPEVHWILLGRDAHRVAQWIDPATSSNYIHCASHPMPLAASRPCGPHPPFLGSGILSRVFTDIGLHTPI